MFVSLFPLGIAALFVLIYVVLVCAYRVPRHKYGEEQLHLKDVPDEILHSFNGQVLVRLTRVFMYLVTAVDDGEVQSRLILTASFGDLKKSFATFKVDHADEHVVGVMLSVREGRTGPAKVPSLEELFSLLDLNGDGELDMDDIIEGADLLRMAKSDAAKLFTSLDTQGRGVLTRDAFNGVKKNGDGDEITIGEEAAVEEAMWNGAAIATRPRGLARFFQLASPQDSLGHEAPPGITYAEFLSCMHKAHFLGKPSTFSDFVDAVDAKVNATTGQSLMYAFLLLTFLILVGCSTTVLCYFQCREFSEVDPPESYLIKDLTLDCNSQRYKLYMAFALPMVLVYPVGIPMLYYTLLKGHKHTVSDQKAMDREHANGLPTVGHLIFLVESYKAEFYYFEVVECIRRLLLGSVIGIVDPRPDSPVSPVLGLLVSFVFIQVFNFRPFKVESNNNLGLIMTYSLTLIFLSALMVKTGQTEGSSKDNDVLFGIVLAFVLFSGPMFILATLVGPSLVACLCSFNPLRNPPAAAPPPPPREGEAAVPTLLSRGSLARMLGLRKKNSFRSPSLAPVGEGTSALEEDEESKGGAGGEKDSPKIDGSPENESALNMRKKKANLQRVDQRALTMGAAEDSLTNNAWSSSSFDSTSGRRKKFKELELPQGPARSKSIRASAAADRSAPPLFPLPRMLPQTPRNFANVYLAFVNL